MSELTAHIKQAFEDFDASYHKLRAHLLHTLGLDEHQLAHDAAAAAKPVIAEAEHDAETAVKDVAASVTAPDPSVPAVAPAPSTPPAA